MMSLEEKKTAGYVRENVHGAMLALVIADLHLLKLYSGHALPAEEEASMIYLPELLILLHHLAWTLEQQPLQSHAAHSPQLYPPM